MGQRKLAFWYILRTALQTLYKAQLFVQLSHFKTETKQRKAKKKKILKIDKILKNKNNKTK